MAPRTVTPKEAARRQRLRMLPLKHGCAVDGKQTREYKSWAAMKRRCLNPNFKNYKHYGGRGITVCERWLSFMNFLADMGTRPPRTSLDRIDNSRGYEPGNCRWATQVEQTRNMRRNRLVTYGNATKTISEWAEDAGLEYGTLETRLRRGWPMERALIPSLIPRKAAQEHFAAINGLHVGL